MQVLAVEREAPEVEVARQLRRESFLVHHGPVVVDGDDPVRNGARGVLVDDHLLPELVAWWVGRHVLKLNPALLMGAVAGARQNTTSMRAAQKESRSAVPGIGYPVPLAIATIALSIVGYFFALFA